MRSVMAVLALSALALAEETSEALFNRTAGPRGLSASKSFGSNHVASSPERLKLMPETFSMLELLLNWWPDDTVVPDKVFDSLPRLNYQNAEERALGLRLRDLDIPFKVYNVPNINEVVRKWSDDDYVLKNMGAQKPYQVHTSHNNHFMYYLAPALMQELKSGLRPSSGYKSPEEAAKAFRAQGYTAAHPPPVPVTMTFKEFMDRTVELEKEHENKPHGEDYPHVYLTTADDWDNGRTMIGRDIDIFRSTNRYFIKDTSDIRGIHCRFGMRGVVAESHWDGHLNFIAMLRGQKRYILSPPESCRFMDIMAEGPSRRHAAIDFSNAESITDPKNAALLHRARAVETVLKEGEVLYLPSYWIHYIISLDRSMQCNCRSGISPLYDEDGPAIDHCDAGKPMPEPSAATIDQAKEIIAKDIKRSDSWVKDAVLRTRKTNLRA